MTLSYNGPHPNLRYLSNSGLQTLHLCPRRFELDKLRSGIERDESIHLSFGTVVGIGVQEMLTHGDPDKAAFAMLKAWKLDLFYDEEDSRKAKKSFWEALIAVDRFLVPRATFFSNMVLAYLGGRPATEVGFTIDCGNDFYYRGFIDAVLIDDMRNELVVVELKTTKFSNVDEAVFKHAGQSLGYSVVLRQIVKLLGRKETPSFRVYYPVYKSGVEDWEVFPFVKTFTKQANWVRALLLDIKHIEEFAEEEFFPMQGEGCYNFFKQCPHFGVCEFENKLLFDAKKVPLKSESEQHVKHDFTFSLEEIIEEQLMGGSAS